MTERQRGKLAIVTQAVLIAAMGVLVRGLGKLGLWEQTAWRVAAAVLLAHLFFLRKPPLAKLAGAPAGELALLGFRAALLYALHVPLLSLAFLESKYLNSCAAYVFPWPTVFGVVLFRERLDGRQAAALGLAVAGIAALSAPGLTTVGLGHLFAFAAGAAAGLQLVTRRYHRPEFSNEDLTTGQLLVGLPMVLVPAVASAQFPDPGQLSWDAAAAIGVAGLANVLCVFLGNYALSGRVTGVEAGSLLTLQVPVAFALGALAGEDVEPLEIAGALLILAGVWGVNSRPGRAAAEAPTRLPCQPELGVPQPT